MFFFFFKQKTAYALRISDWSSDVCSSDLARPAPRSRSRRRGCPSSIQGRWFRCRGRSGAWVGVVNLELEIGTRLQHGPGDGLEIDRLDAGEDGEALVGGGARIPTHPAPFDFVAPCGPLDSHTYELQSQTRIPYACIGQIT